MLGHKITILMYHSVNPTPDAYSVSPKAFRQQLKFVRDNYPVVALRDIGQQFKASNERTVVVTFDDAFVDFLEFARPVLLEYSIPATIFVPTGFFGKWNSWDAHLAQVTRKRVMTTDELRTLSHGEFVDFGSHTVDHVRMSAVSVQEMRRQAVSSRRALEDLLGSAITMFSYPYGQRDDFSRETARALVEADYQLAVTTCWGTRNSPRDILTLQRISLKDSDDLATVRAKIEGRYDWIRVKERVGFTLRSGMTMMRSRG